MQTQLVIARFNEDISWSNCFPSIIYNKGEYQSNSINIKNVGREAHTYLYHIINNYDNLAEVTCFFQGTKPSFGPKAGHLCSGVKIQDYFDSQKFIYTCSISADESRHRMRNSYRSWQPINNVPSLPANTNNDHWTMFENYKWSSYQFKKLKDSQNLKFYHFKDFVNNVLEININDIETINYAQGAQFSLNKNTIISKPKKYYENIMQFLMHLTCPAECIFMEWAWGLIFDYNNATQH